MATTIKVNGVDRTVDVDGDTPLLWVLRDVLGMTGTKFGCGMALCGACTVHVDGVATRSCITPIDSIGSSAITTIEGIGATAAGAKIQKAWLDREVVQCGYCQSGQIMSASALLASNPQSDRFRYRRRHVRQHLPLRDLCAHSRSDQAGRAIERTGRLTMILDQITSRAADSDRSPSASGFSRRAFLQAGAAAGGGLLLSLRLPLANGDAEAADASFVPNAFIRIDRDGQIVLTMPYVEMGQGTYTSIPMLIAEELEVELIAGTARACPAQREALRQPLARRHPGNRQLERGPRVVAAAAPGRCDRANHAGRGGGKALECRSGVLPRAKRRSAARADGKTRQVWRARRRCRPHARARERSAQATGGFQAHRHPGQAA